MSLIVISTHSVTLHVSSPFHFVFRQQISRLTPVRDVPGGEKCGQQTNESLIHSSTCPSLCSCDPRVCVCVLIYWCISIHFGIIRMWLLLEGTGRNWKELEGTGNWRNASLESAFQECERELVF